MNMNKKIFTMLLILCSFFILNKVVSATTTTVVNCNSLSTEAQCSAFGKCRWMSGSCQAQYVASEPCNDNNIRNVLKIAGYILLIAKLVVPILIIGYGIFDMYKAVIDKDEKSLPKQAKRLIMRVVTGLIIFFIPTIVNGLFKLSDKLDIVDTDEYQTCASCVLDPLDTTKCSTTDVFTGGGISE